MPLYQLKISGRVQDVSYRYSTKRQADFLGLTGIVRNETDGTVYAEIEGEEAQLQQMIDWCRHGPAPAEVSRVEVASAPEKNYLSFEIIRSTKLY